jgi:hypothetical protein
MGRKLRFAGQPPPRWPVFMREASRRLASAFAWRSDTDPVTQIAEEIVRHGDGEKFLKAVRRGRATQRQNLRYQLLRVVEEKIGASVPRRREDRNTPEAQRFK